MIDYRRPEGKERLRALSPNGRVPLLVHAGNGGNLMIWESLSVCEYVAELAPEARLWPDDPAARAIARSVACEMHAGFGAVRRALDMALHERREAEIDAEVRRDIARIEAIWTECRRDWGMADRGEWLFGHFTVADAMFVPGCHALPHLRCRAWRGRVGISANDLQRSGFPYLGRYGAPAPGSRACDQLTPIRGPPFTAGDHSALLPVNLDSEQFQSNDSPGSRTVVLFHGGKTRQTARVRRSIGTRIQIGHRNEPTGFDDDTSCHGLTRNRRRTFCAGVTALKFDCTSRNL